MRKFRLLAILTALILSLNIAYAQTYRTAVGVRVGQDADLTIQQYVTNNWTLEGILHTSIFSNELGFSVLAEKHHKLFVRNFNFYYGPGFHYYWNDYANRRDNVLKVYDVAGLSLIGGVELSLGRLNFAVDWKPEIHVTGDQVYPFEWNGTAVSVRWIIDKRARKKISVFDRRRNRKRW